MHIFVWLSWVVLSGCAHHVLNDSTPLPLRYRISGEMTLWNGQEVWRLALKTVVSPNWQWVYVSSLEGKPLAILSFEKQDQDVVVVDAVKGCRVQAHELPFLEDKWDLHNLKDILRFNHHHLPVDRKKTQIQISKYRYHSPVYRLWKFEGKGKRIKIALQSFNELDAQEVSLLHQTFETQKKQKWHTFCGSRI